MKWVLLGSFYRCKNEGRGRLSDLPKATELVAESKRRPRNSGSRAQALHQQSVLPFSGYSQSIHKQQSSIRAPGTLLDQSTYSHTTTRKTALTQPVLNGTIHAGCTPDRTS